MLEFKSDSHSIVVDKYHAPGGDYTMTVRDYVLRPSTASVSTTITLPPVVEAAGRIYSIVARSFAPMTTITIEDNNDDSECWDGDIQLSTKCDRALCYSDGLTWHVFIDGPTGSIRSTDVPTTAAAVEQTTEVPTTSPI